MSGLTKKSVILKRRRRKKKVIENSVSINLRAKKTPGVSYNGFLKMIKLKLFFGKNGLFFEIISINTFAHHFFGPLNR